MVEVYQEIQNANLIKIIVVMANTDNQLQDFSRVMNSAQKSNVWVAIELV